MANRMSEIHDGYSKNDYEERMDGIKKTQKGILLCQIRERRGKGLSGRTDRRDILNTKMSNDKGWTERGMTFFCPPSLSTRIKTKKIQTRKYHNKLAFPTFQGSEYQSL
jgi:hypothetical protein